MISRAWTFALTAFVIAAGCGERTQPPNGKSQSTESHRSASVLADCASAPNDVWSTARVFDYIPAQSRYTVVWEVCPAEITGRRVRVTDANYKRVFYTFADDEILRTEEVELLSHQPPQLLIVTGSSGTDDRTTWHILSESQGELQEWHWPELEASAAKLLHTDEDFCCKEWNIHLVDHEIFLAEGIYRKGEGNCCPSRGGVLVRLKAKEGLLKISKVERISAKEYDRWRNLGFCLHCVLGSQ
jgi:hypothetical protein